MRYQTRGQSGWIFFMFSFVLKVGTRLKGEFLIELEFGMLVFEKKGNRSTRWRTSRSGEENWTANSLPFSPDLVKKVLACAIPKKRARQPLPSRTFIHARGQCFTRQPEKNERLV